MLKTAVTIAAIITIVLHVSGHIYLVKKVFIENIRIGDGFPNVIK